LRTYAAGLSKERKEWKNPKEGKTNNNMPRDPW